MGNAGREEQGSCLSRRAQPWRFWGSLLLTLGALLWSLPARAQEPGDSLTISLLTMGVGEHPFTKFGHSALWVHDAAAGRDEIYNYGTFAFDSPTLFFDSAQGKLPYWLSVQSLGGTLRSYGEAQRSLLVSELELTPSERSALYSALRENERPENRYYRYDFYRDNCATRIRDAIDHVIGGQIHAQTQKPARMSFRSHTLRLVADDPVLYAALDLALGRGTDAPITFWDEGFLPSRLRDLLLDTKVVHDGQTLPLVRGERQMLPSSFPEPRALPPDWIGRYFRLGVALAALFAALGLGAHSGGRLRTTLAVTFMALALPLGLVGSALCYLTFISWHFAAANNCNVLLLPPWLLLLVVVGPSMARGKAWAWGLSRLLLSTTLLCSIAAALLHVLQRNPQQNWPELAFALPLWLGATAAAWLGSASVHARPGYDTRG
ncbi:MAG TPA: DUF4105 domain-containing protein [Polyangiaceae bacterium]|nr:DUF4105 domain-containing protein [Polyangiaceae bacterium]